MAIVLVNDATHGNLSTLPRGQAAAGYSTGSGDVPWTPQDWATHPGAVRICQDPGGTDTTADIYDVEQYAGTIARAPGWAKAALANYRTGIRPGQRSPAIYLNLFNVTPVINALTAAGVTSGIGLWLANWNNNQAVSAGQVLAASGPFPVIGIQFHNAGNYDISVFSSTWLNTVSGGGPPGGDATITEGDTGAGVTKAQGRLNVHHAAPTVTVDGAFGPATTTAARTFQGAQSLPVDGTIGPVTWTALNQAPPVPLAAGQLPAPTGLAIDRKRLPLQWNPVPGAAGYTAVAYGVDGKECARTVTSPGQNWCVLNNLAGGGTYTVHVWANGGKVAPAGTSLTVTLPH